MVLWTVIVEEEEDGKNAPGTESSQVSKRMVSLQTSHPDIMPQASLTVLTAGGAVIRPTVLLCGP